MLTLRTARKMMKDSHSFSIFWQPVEVSGGTLIETMISVAIFAVLVLSVFAVFQIGNENWSLMVVDHSLQTDGRKAAIVLERSLESTAFSDVQPSYNSINPTNSSNSGLGYTIPRDAIAMPAVDNWSNPFNFDPKLGLPIWDEFVIYMATTQTDSYGNGELLEITIGYNESMNGYKNYNACLTPPGTNCLDPYISGTNITPLNIFTLDGDASTIIGDVNADVKAGKSWGAISKSLFATFPWGTPTPIFVDVVPLTPVYAFEVDKCAGPPGCDTPSFGIAFKVRRKALQQQGAGVVKVSGGGGTETVINGMQSFQINLVVSPQANHNF